MESAPKYVFLGLLVAVVGGLVALAIIHKSNSPQEPPLQGAGSTFVQPLMVQWSADYENTESGCRIGYRSIGSGGGIKLFLANKVNFACSDAPLTDEQMAQVRASGREPLHIPLVHGAVVPAYHIPGVKGTLKFTGKVLADIYLGNIKKWNEKPLTDLNPDAGLPPLEIVVFHREDSSGTTYIWADYLAKVSPEWKEKVGVATDLKWPAGVGEDGNPGVAKKVKQTPGSIGYIELIYAYRLDLPHGLVENADKEFVKASLPSLTEAAANGLGTIPKDMRFSLINAPGKGSYPIVGTTWAIVNARQSRNKGHHLVGFLTWAVGDGQYKVPDLLYARLPEALQEKSRALIETIKID